MTALLPPNVTAIEAALEQLVHARADAIVVPLRDLWSAENCPEGLLPWLAWTLSIDQWSADWPLHIRRARVGAAMAVQRIKGTAQSVSDVVESFGGSVRLTEWHQKSPRATPFTFSLMVLLGGQADAAYGADFIDAVIAEVRRTKPVRSAFDFTVAANAIARIGLFVTGRPVIGARLLCAA